MSTLNFSESLLINRLNEFYIDNRISALRFECTSRTCCKAATENHGGKFTTAREISLGERYFESRPRIVVVSLDPGSQFDKTKGRYLNPDEMKIQIRRDPASKKELGSENRHWYRTHQAVAAIVKAVTGNAITPNPGYEAYEAALWFAHTSVVRCCANLKDARQAPWEMFWSCRRYIEDEIQILKPDVIWTQGEQASDAMSWIARYMSGDSSLAREGVIHANCRWGFLRWINTYHPSAPAYWGSGWERAMKIFQSLQPWTRSSN
jgi:uracil-DNA glycosylase